MKEKIEKVESWRCFTCRDRMTRNKQPIRNCNTCFKNQSRRKAEEQLSKLSGDPITVNIAGKKIWNDHLMRCGIKHE